MNADPNLIDIRQFLSEVHHGPVIVTTRSSKVSIGRRMKINTLEDTRDNLLFLSDASHREAVIDSKLMSSNIGDTKLGLLDSNAIEIARKLDRLPLALATAGAYFGWPNPVHPNFLHIE